MPPLAGLVLAGGQSRRMGQDKANLVYRGSGDPQWMTTAGLLRAFCSPVWISIRRGQELVGTVPEGMAMVEDGPESMGPLSGMLAAASRLPGHAWLVVACDLPLVTVEVLGQLVDGRGGASVVAYRSAHDGLPEPLCSIYEPSMMLRLERALKEGLRCPRKILIHHSSVVQLLDLADANALENANTPEEHNRLNGYLRSRSR